MFHTAWWRFKNRNVKLWKMIVRRPCVLSYLSIFIPSDLFTVFTSPHIYTYIHIYIDIYKICFAIVLGLFFFYCTYTKYMFIKWEMNQNGNVPFLQNSYLEFTLRYSSMLSICQIIKNYYFDRERSDTDKNLGISFPSSKSIGVTTFNYEEKKRKNSPSLERVM